MKQPESLLPPEIINPATELCQKILIELDRQLLGREQLHRTILIGILAHGHVLLEGLPGLGKTAFIHALGKVMFLKFNRVQFTPDLMPGDILGTHILQQDESGNRVMEFQEGPVFTNILLADEINRASPKTQSALLEVMQERSVTLLGKTRKLPLPFFVLASQNPIELEGTYPLPEAQLDRFLLKVPVPALPLEVMAEIIDTRRHGNIPDPEWGLTPEQLQQIDSVLDGIWLPPAVARFIAAVVDATHPTSKNAPDEVRSYVKYGASPRAAIGIAEAARAEALLSGRPSVGFEDVTSIAPYVLNHRVLLNYQARYDECSVFDIIDKILTTLPASGWDTPAGVELKGADA